MDIPFGQGLILAELEKPRYAWLFLSETDLRCGSALSNKSLMSCARSGEGGQGGVSRLRRGGWAVGLEKVVMIGRSCEHRLNFLCLMIDEPFEFVVAHHVNNGMVVRRP